MLEDLNSNLSILNECVKPIVIYNNTTFHKIYFESKYKKIIEDEIKIEHRYQMW